MNNDNNNEPSSVKEKGGMEQSVEEKDRDRLLKNIYDLPSTICSTLIIVSAIYIVGSICLTSMFLQNGEDGIKIINSLAEVNIVSVGLATVAIAVSVWVGLNIYNYLSRDEVDRLQENIKKIQVELDQSNLFLNEINNSFHELAFQTLISTISRSGERYIISAFFAEKIRQTDLTDLSIELINRVSIAESEYDDLTEYYEAGRLTDCYQTCDAVKNKFIGLREELNKLDEHSKYQVLQKYIDSRVGDCLFYKNVSANRMFNSDEMREVIRLFKGIEKYIDEDKDLQQVNKETYLSYCYNTIGYTYDQIYVRDKANEDDKEQAIKYSEESVDKPGTMAKKHLARYTRNLGLAYEHDGDLKKALEQYEKSAKLDRNDYKSWNNIASATLKLLEKRLKVSGRETVLCRFEKNAFKEYMDKLRYAEAACKMSISINAAFMDPYYKLINIYMYLLLGGYDETVNQNNGQDRIVFLEKINFETPGFLFAKRNFYEACGDIKTAAENNEIIIEKFGTKNDALHMRNIYSNYLKESDAPDGENGLKEPIINNNQPDNDQEDNSESDNNQPNDGGLTS